VPIALVIVLAQTDGGSLAGVYQWAFAAMAMLSLVTLFSAALLRRHPA
jgi:hypothetical protein